MVLCYSFNAISKKKLYIPYLLTKNIHKKVDYDTPKAIFSYFLKNMKDIINKKRKFRFQEKNKVSIISKILKKY